MIRTPSPEDARRLREYLIGEGYTEDALVAHLHAVEACVPRARNRARILDLTDDPTPHNMLVRWFIAGEAIGAGAARKVIREDALAGMLACGLLAERDGRLVPQAMIQPHAGLLIAADPFMRHEQGAADYVLGVSPPGRWLLDFLVRRPARRALDLCSGCGLHAVAMAGEHAEVVATDQNPRATGYASFNAVLNGRGNVACRTGDLLEPVAGERFDTIAANPPFFVSPSRRFIYRDNPAELDAFCRHIVKTVPQHLEDGGYFQAICEWVKVEGQPAEERIAEWFQGAGCDVWLLHLYSMDPSWYAQTRIRESPEASPELDAQTYEEWVEYLRERGVEAVHGGLIAMRRRDAAQTGHALRMEALRDAPREPFGDAVLTGFAGLELLAERTSDEVLLGSRLRLFPNVRLETTATLAEGGWRGESATLHQTSGLRRAIQIDTQSAVDLATLDGTRTLDSLCHEIAGRGQVDESRVRSELLRAARLLIELGFLGR